MRSTLALVWFALTCGGCSISHRSGEFACTDTSQCNSGRTCIGGFCVVSGPVDASHGEIDAPSGHLDAGMSTCPPQCTTCNVAAKTCTIDCETTDCTGTVTCPAGYTCNINCNAIGSCTQGIDCAMAKACTIACTERQSCENVECGSGTCDLMCTGRQSCEDVDCGSSCKCDVACTGLDACGGTITCPSPICIGSNGQGCSSTTDPSFCSTCQ